MPVAQMERRELRNHIRTALGWSLEDDGQDGLRAAEAH